MKKEQLPNFLKLKDVRQDDDEMLHSIKETKIIKNHQSGELECESKEDLI